jgi:hypothetical protein
MIRSFDLRDITTLMRYRDQGLYLDSVRALTWGGTLVSAGAMLYSLSAATGVISAVGIDETDSRHPIIGQVTHLQSSPVAHFTFLAPDSAVDSPSLSALIEYLVTQLGERGAHCLVADVDERTYTYEALRHAGFSVYTRQQMWKVEKMPSSPAHSRPWRKADSSDEFAVRTLYSALVPGLVQQVEPDIWRRLRCHVYYHADGLLAFADYSTGPRGVWVQPFVHPETLQVASRLVDLLAAVPPRNGRPVYLCVRSYQGWLEHVLDELGAESGPRQAVMVKRMTAAIQQPALKSLPSVSRTTEPTIPYSQTNAHTSEHPDYT